MEVRGGKMAVRIGCITGLAMILGCVQQSPVATSDARNATVTAAASCDPNDIVIGALLPLTGDQKDTGAILQASAALAVSSLNDTLQGKGSSQHVRLDVQDTASSEQGALTAIQHFTPCTRVAVGPTSTPTVTAVLGYALEHHIALVATDVSAAILTGSSDNLFRADVSSDGYATGLASALGKDGKTCVVALVRHDPYGQGFLADLKDALPQFGSQLVGEQSYFVSGKDFAQEINQLADKVQYAQKTCAGGDTSKVGIVAITQSQIVELVPYIQQAPILLDYEWYAADQATDAIAVLNSAVFLQFLEDVHMKAIVLGVRPENQANYAAFIQQLSNAGITNDRFVGAPMYMAAETAGTAALQTPLTASDATFEQTILTVSSQVKGLLGKPGFNKNGDFKDWYFELLGVADGALTQASIIDVSQYETP